MNKEYQELYDLAEKLINKMMQNTALVNTKDNSDLLAFSVSILKAWKDTYVTIEQANKTIDDLENKTKEKILTRLFNTSGYFSGGMRNLPNTLKTDDVLRAINVDEYFYPEQAQKD